MRTLRGLGWPPMHRPFISSIAVAASDVLENLMYVTPEIVQVELIILKSHDAGHASNLCSTSFMCKPWSISFTNILYHIFMQICLHSTACILLCGNNPVTKMYRKLINLKYIKEHFLFPCPSLQRICRIHYQWGCMCQWKCMSSINSYVQNTKGRVGMKKN